MRSIFPIMLLVVGLQVAKAQKITLHMTGNQKVEYSVLQLDSITFTDNDSQGVDPSIDPSVTDDAIDITNKSATLVGYASSIRDNLSTDLRVGFIYCLEGTPSKNNGTRVDVAPNDVAANGRYTATISNLLPGTTYYFRSFVYQSGIWFYGKVKSFVTDDTDITFITGEATDVTCFSSKVSGSVSVQSEYSTLQLGICYGTAIAPTVSDNNKKASSAGSFTFLLQGLMGGTNYYYRPYAIVDGKVRYGNVRTFRTHDDDVVETGDIDPETLIVSSRLTIGGGAYSTLSLGVCYGWKELPTVNDWTVTANEVDDENRYTVQLVNIGTTSVYYRAYVLIDGIAHYGEVKKLELDNSMYVDLGLPSGTLWAICNVGANSPDEYGDDFSWGETEPKSECSWSTYKYCNGTYDTLTKYCTQSKYGTVDNKMELEPVDDAATVNWGSDWQTPSPNQIIELCNSNYTKLEGFQVGDVKGVLVRSKINGNVLFFPSADSYDDEWNITLWSRSLCASDSRCAASFSLHCEACYEYDILFDEDGMPVFDDDGNIVFDIVGYSYTINQDFDTIDRICCKSVRPVRVNIVEN